MFSFIHDLEEHRKYLKRKDEIAIKKVERRFIGKTRQEKKFYEKVYGVYDGFKMVVPLIICALKEYLDNPVAEAIIGTPFSEKQAYSVLMDMKFVGMLMCNNLIRRAANLRKGSEGQVKLRVYIAILNYYNYREACMPNKPVRKRR